MRVWMVARNWAGVGQSATRPAHTQYAKPYPGDRDPRYFRPTESTCIALSASTVFSILAASGIFSFSPRASAADWLQFGGDAASSGASTDATGITMANIGSLQRRQVALDGTVDASAIYLHALEIKGAPHDVFFVTTTYGKTIAIDADQWRDAVEIHAAGLAVGIGSRQITNSTPAADPDRQHIYAAAPDGTSKSSTSPTAMRSGAPRSRCCGTEKIASPLSYYRGHVIAVTGGYIGDAPPYQGHVAILDAPTGKLFHVWNSLCSDRPGLIVPSDCPRTVSAIWGRAGAVIDPSTGDIFVATGNGPYDGKTDWGDSTLQLDPDGTRLVGNYTPSNNAQLDDRDLDIGSTSPVLLGGSLVAQGGKDKQIRLLDLGSIAGTAPHQGHELQIVSTPSSAMLFTAPAVWRNEGTTWMFAADGGGTAAWTLEGGKLVEKWKNGNGGTSPVVAGGLLYVYDPHGKLRVYEPTKGNRIAELERGHRALEQSHRGRRSDRAAGG